MLSEGCGQLHDPGSTLKSAIILVARDASLIEIHSRKSLFVSGGRNVERGMIALRVQDPAARQEEAQIERMIDRVEHARRKLVAPAKFVAFRGSRRSCRVLQFGGK